MKSELLTIPEFCKTTNIGRTVTYKLINQGDIEAVKVGKKTLITRSSLDAFVSSLPSYKSKT